MKLRADEYVDQVLNSVSRIPRFGTKKRVETGRRC